MKLRDDLTLRHLGEDHIIVDPGQDMVDMSKVYTLNDSAALVWDGVQGSEFTVERIAEILVENYEVSADVAVADAHRLLMIFDSQGLLVGKE